MTHPSIKRRSLDHVTETLTEILSDGKIYEFKDLTAELLTVLKAKNAVSGGEEMIRLRCYEKLLNLASQGLVEKKGKTYRGLKGLEQVRSDSFGKQLERAVVSA